MQLYKPKKNQTSKGNRLLVTITVLGSPGPIRFVVSEEELVAAVIDTTLKSYAKEGRLPVLGSDINNFVLYCPNVGKEALSPWETIGSHGVRNFMLCKKQQAQNAAVEDGGKSVGAPPRISRKVSSNSWKAWFNKSLTRKVSSH